MVNFLLKYLVYFLRMFIIVWYNYGMVEVYIGKLNICSYFMKNLFYKCVKFNCYCKVKINYIVKVEGSCNYIYWVRCVMDYVFK